MLMMTGGGREMGVGHIVSHQNQSVERPAGLYQKAKRLSSLMMSPLSPLLNAAGMVTESTRSRSDQEDLMDIMAGSVALIVALLLFYFIFTRPL